MKKTTRTVLWVGGGLALGALAVWGGLKLYNRAQTGRAINTLARFSRMRREQEAAKRLPPKPLPLDEGQGEPNTLIDDIDKGATVAFNIVAGGQEAGLW